MAAKEFGLTLIVKDQQTRGILFVLLFFLVTQHDPISPSKCHSDVPAPMEPLPLEMMWYPSGSVSEPLS